MAAKVLTDAEYQLIEQLEKSLLEHARTASSPRAGAHLRAAAKMHTDFLAREQGKRVTAQQRAAAKEQSELQRLQRQQERLAALQKKMEDKKKPPAGPAPEPSKPRA